MKEPKCKLCGGSHYKTFCFSAPKKALKQKAVTSTLKPKKPLRTAHISPRSKSNERKKLVYELDRVFSLYIRHKDAVDGYAYCVTCPAKGLPEEMQNGHFISRGKSATRWNEMNCHVQCPNCNEALSGNLVRYRQYMEYTYGEDAVNSLVGLSISGLKITTPELKELIHTYRRLLNNLDNRLAFA